MTDFHNDFLTNQNVVKIFKRYNNNNQHVVCALFRGKRDFICARKLCKLYLQNASINMRLAFEDFGYNEDISLLRYGLLTFNPLYVGLTWNGENNLAFGAGSHGKVKLKGKLVINELNKMNIALDVAHLSYESFFSCVDYTSKIVCSHTCFYSINEHIRNLKDEQIKHIIKKNGIIGLTLYTPFLTKNKVGTIIDVYKHIDFFVQKFGDDNLAIGSDFYGCDNLPIGFKRYGFDDRLTDYLLSHGYSYLTCKKILYQNLDNYISNQ